MAIEVKQLTINTSINADSEESASAKTEEDKEKISDICADVENIKIDIIAECQRLIKASIRRTRER